MTPQEIERTLASSLMQDTSALAKAVGVGLKPKHFADSFAADVFSAAVKLWEKQEPLDLGGFAMLLGRGKIQDLADLRLEALPGMKPERLIEAVIDSSRQVEIQSRLTEISRALAARRPMEPLGPHLEKLAGLLTTAQATTALRTTGIQESLAKSIEAAEQRMLLAKDGGLPGIPSGISFVDHATYGFQPGFVYVLGARTSVGKSTLATVIAVNAARAGHRVNFVTVEMSDSDIADKMLTRVSFVSMSRFLSGDIDDDETDRIHRGTGELANLPISITEVFSSRLEPLAMEIQRLVRVEGVKLVIIDYLQLFDRESAGFRASSRETAKDVSVAIKQLARQLNVPILVLSQLNRQAPEFGEPELVHIAESDQIGRDADVVLMLFRDEGGDYFLSVKKNRRGTKGTFALKAQLHFNLFSDPLPGRGS